MPGGVDEVLLRHPNGSLVVLVGTQHVSATHGCAAQEAVARWGQPPTVLLELDQERFQELNLRLVHLIHHDTASLLKLAAQPATAAEGSIGAACRQLLPDALLWLQHQQQFQTVRNEGVPLLLGSLYGSDMLQAALAAAAAAAAVQDQQQQQQQASNNSGSHAGTTSRRSSSSSCSIVLADQPQEITMARFRALSSGLALRQLGLWLASLLPGSIAHAEAALIPAAGSGVQTHSGCSSSGGGGDGSTGTCALVSGQQQQRQPSVLLSAAHLAVGRLLHLCVQWWSMALSSQADWYGHNVHPVFLLVNNVPLQQQLQEKGVEGVSEAAAAAARMLQAAAAGAAPTAADLSAVRTFAASLESVQCSTGTGSSSRAGSSSSSSSNGSIHDDDDLALLTRSWWVSLSEKFGANFIPLGVNFPQQRQQQHHVNHTAAMAYEQAVMAERNAVLADALWSQTAAAATAAGPVGNAAGYGSSGGSSSSSSSWFGSLWGSTAAAAGATVAGGAAAAAMRPVVLGVVGKNHLPGIVQDWEQRELQWHSQKQQQQQQQHADGSSGNLGPSRWQEQQQRYQELSSRNLGPPQEQYAALRVATTDAAADALEFFAAGSAGLAYICAVSKVTQPKDYATAAAAAAGAPSPAAAAAAGAPSPAAAAAGMSVRYPNARRLRALNMVRSLAHSSSSSSSTAVFQQTGHTGGRQQQQQQRPLMRQLYTNLMGRMPPAHHMKRMGLLLLPVGIALLPLQRDAGRYQEASRLLHNVAVVNDVMTLQGQYGTGMASILRLAGVLPAS